MWMLTKWIHCERAIRTGGVGDKGVDMVGKWNIDDYLNTYIDQKSAFYNKRLSSDTLLGSSLPNASSSAINLKHDINFMAQCKNTHLKIRPTTVREIMGIYNYHVPTRSDHINNFMFLISPQVLTKQGYLAFDTYSVPLIHFRLSSLTCEDPQKVLHLENYKGGILESFYVNHRAQALLEGLDLPLHLQRFLGLSILDEI